MTNKELFVYFIKEREDIRIMREMGFPYPWTDDVILQSIRFTNIDREKDKTTVCIRNNVKCIDDYLYARLYLCRIFNTIGVLSRINWNTDIHNVLGQWENLFKYEPKIPLSSAYFIPTQVRRPNMTLSRSYVAVVNDYLPTFKSYNKYTTCSSTYKAINNTSDMCLGCFITGQIVADAKYTKGSNIYNAADKYSFACHGPGSLVGISAYFDSKITPRNFYEKLIIAHNETVEALIRDNREDICEQIQDLHNFQNCFCEFGKYYRCKYDDTYKVRRKYRV